MSQKAAVYAKKHEYPVVQERPIPTPGVGQLLVKIESIGINPLEWKIIDYEMFGDPPMVLGYDTAGIVEKVGPNVTAYKKGDRIVSWATRETDDHAAFQQYGLMRADPFLTAKIPDNITFDEAATLPTGLNTAQVALYDKDGFGFPSPFEGNTSFGKGKALFVVGGASVIGLVALQFARLSGFTTIIANGSKANESIIKEYGATHFIDRSLSIDEQVSKIRSIAPSLAYAWDAIGVKDTNTLAARSFGSEGGLIVSSMPVNADVLGEYKNVKGKNIYSNPLVHQESAAKVWSNIEEALKKGEFKPLPYKVAPGGIAGIAEALITVKKASGYKVVVHAQE